MLSPEDPRVFMDRHLQYFVCPRDARVSFGYGYPECWAHGDPATMHPLSNDQPSKTQAIFKCPVEGCPVEAIVRTVNYPPR